MAAQHFENTTHDYTTGTAVAPCDTRPGLHDAHDAAGGAAKAGLLIRNLPLDVDARLLAAESEKVAEAGV